MDEGTDGRTHAGTRSRQGVVVPTTTAAAPFTLVCVLEEGIPRADSGGTYTHTESVRGFTRTFRGPILITAAPSPPLHSVPLCIPRSVDTAADGKLVKRG